MNCYFCDEVITEMNGRDSNSLAEHHIDGNHNNDSPENRTDCHYGCHSRYHQKTESGRKRWAEALENRHAFTSEKTRLKLSRGMKKRWRDGEVNIKYFGCHSQAFREGREAFWSTPSEARDKAISKRIKNIRRSIGNLSNLERKRLFGRNVTGDKNPMFGKTLSKDHIKALREGYQKYREKQKSFNQTVEGVFATQLL